MNRLIITSFLVFVALAGSVTAMAYTGSKSECKETGSCCKKEAAVSADNSSCHSNAEMTAGSAEAKPCCKKK
ncbi:MAG: hypothetical protein MUC87_13610 [Bacteroidia bacterium]|jgi:hypothetical protein|nr:hypothetical protein [Bacteroidia bacterium]